MAEGKRLRQWEEGSYNKEGRYSTLGAGEGKDKKHEVPREGSGGMRGIRTMPKNASDPGRRNK